ncbi:MAG TPA: bifunctional nuclease family protein [Anaerolineales bacterium]|nr:bifunctional nuclease family protein [Anaerolineales bacterium]
MSDMVEVVIDSVRVSLMSPQRVVVLRQAGLERYLAIWVGPFEAEHITVALQEVELSRPMTHDLLKNVFSQLDAKIMRIEIVALKGDTFYGNIVVKANEKIIDIDSRPSDAIALAVRAHVPILVSQEVMDEAGIVPERDMQAEKPAPAVNDTRPLPPSPAKSEEADLDVFEDFLKKLKDEPGDEEEKPKPG